MEELKPGDQIAYVPMHAEGDLTHKDVEFGFVTGFNREGDVFCRYWSHFDGSLRTTINSELTPRENIVKLDESPIVRLRALARFKDATSD